MRRLELLWMFSAQAIHLASLLAWLRMMDYIRAAFAGPGGDKLVWPVFVTGVALLYPVFLIACSGIAWWNFAKRESKLALIFISLPLFFSLPLAAYAFLVQMALR